MITRDELDTFFSETRSLFVGGRAKWSIDNPCRWSYFFVDPDREKLAPVGRHLETLGYDVIGLLEPDPEPAEQLYYLRADRIEFHTVDSLLARNVELHAVAAKYGVSDYDGMDVGSVDGP